MYNVIIKKLINQLTVTFTKIKKLKNDFINQHLLELTAAQLNNKHINKGLKNPIIIQQPK